jgi:hypothetical protein
MVLVKKIIKFSVFSFLRNFTVTISEFQDIIKLRINSNINCVLISVFLYLFKNKTIEDQSES